MGSQTCVARAAQGQGVQHESPVEGRACALGRGCLPGRRIGGRILLHRVPPNPKQGRRMHRVVVTGLGAVTPVGNNVNDTWEAVLAGQSGIGRITRFDPSGLRTQIAAEVKGFTPSPYLSSKEARRMDPLAHYAASAAGQALEDAGLEDWTGLDRSRVAVVIGAAVGGMTTMVAGQVELMAKGAGSISPFFIPAILANTPGALIAMKYYGIKEAGLAVVDMPHDGNDRRPGLKQSVIRVGKPLIALRFAG